MKLRPEELNQEKIDRDTEIIIRDNYRLEDLTEAIKQLTDKASWVKNINIENKEQERSRFIEAREDGDDFKPEFSFKQPSSAEEAKIIVERLKKEIEEIDSQDIDKYNPEIISSEDIRKLFDEILYELDLYAELSAEIEDEEQWRSISEQIWPMIDKETYQSSVKWLKQNENNVNSLEENLSPKDLYKMFEDEVEKLDMDYNVEIRDVGGCFNIPEDRTVVVAAGSGDKTRKYSKEEAKMLTKHEIFHAIRAYNGYKAGEESGFPPILGIHTPFYDQTEEGGALYREQKTNTNYLEKDFDYHLRTVAAYKIAESDNFRKDFQNIVETLIELGGSVERSFYLVARNREALRHHIYLNGVNEWKNNDNLQALMLGKMNPEYADKFSKEAKSSGMLKEPEISPEKVFNTGF